MIHISEAAVTEIKSLQNKDPEKSCSQLRVKVVGGGCSGMSYSIDFDKEPLKDQDKIFEKDGVTLVVDAKSYLYLMGTTLDFSGGLSGKGFTFDNPNAKRTCGCGSSFSV